MSESEKPTARQRVEQFVVEWCHAAGAPTGYVRERLAPLMDDLRREVIVEAEKWIAGSMSVQGPYPYKISDLAQDCRELGRYREGQ